MCTKPVTGHCPRARMQGGYAATGVKHPAVGFGNQDTGDNNKKSPLVYQGLFLYIMLYDLVIADRLVIHNGHRYDHPAG